MGELGGSSQLLGIVKISKDFKKIQPWVSQLGKLNVHTNFGP